MGVLACEAAATYGPANGPPSWVELTPAGLTTTEYLGRLTWQGAHNRYPQGIPDKVRHLIERELREYDERRAERNYRDGQTAIRADQAGRNRRRLWSDHCRAAWSPA